MAFRKEEKPQVWGKETIQIADTGLNETVVSNGWLADNSLEDVMETYLDRVTGDHVYENFGRLFPLLVKHLSIKGRTPLMVSPDDVAASERYDSLGKLKFWYVTDAEPGSKVYAGLKHPLSATGFCEACADGSIFDHLNAIEPHIGDSFIIFPGTLHAAEGGIGIQEIAESSALDFFLTYAKDAEGKSLPQQHSYTIEDEHELFEEVAEVLDFVSLDKWDTNLWQKGGKTVETVTKLLDSKQFMLNRLNLGEPLSLDTENLDSAVVYACVSGEVSLQVEEMRYAAADGSEPKPANLQPFISSYIIKAGEAIVVPSETTKYILSPRSSNTVVLEALVGVHEDEDSYLEQNQN